MKQVLNLLVLTSVITVSVSAPPRPNCMPHRVHQADVGWLKSPLGQIPTPELPTSPKPTPVPVAPAKPPHLTPPKPVAAPAPPKNPAPPPPTPPKPSVPAKPAPPKPNSVAQAYLDAHNKARAAHAAAPLAWSDTLARAAQVWANKCVGHHSGGSLGKFGENLAWGPTSFKPTDAVNLWNAEKAQYNPRNPVMSHFTQVVWRNTSQVGCASATCPHLINNNVGTMYVCEYNPPGNWAGQYAQNVIV